jgi:site-specific recombinase XerD
MKACIACAEEIQDAATTMLEAGVPIHIVSRILGHSKINITVDI